VTGTYLGPLKKGEIAPSNAIALAEKAALATPDLALIDGTQMPISLDAIHNAGLAARTLNSENRHLLVVVDSLHTWADRVGSHMTEYDRLNVALDSLRTLSHRLSAAILIIAERNRLSMTSGGMSAGAGSRKIEYTAETVLDLDSGKEDGRGNTPVTLTLRKNRHGSPGRDIRLLFHGSTQKFTEAS
jgi:hypothetical protein